MTYSIYKAGLRYIDGTPLGKVLGRVLFAINTYRFRVETPTFYRSMRPLPFSDVVLSMSEFNNRLLYGEYEKPVLDWLSQVVDEDTAFWEIGARYGYFSFTVAQVADKVVAVEADKDALQLLRLNRAINDANNVTIIPGFVPEEVPLGNNEPPDIALIDLEGAELAALESAEPWLGITTFVIEIHEWAEYAEADVIELLKSHGYTVREINRRQTTHHLVGEP